VLWNQGVHTGREVTSCRPYILVTIKTRLNTHASSCEDGNFKQNNAGKEKKLKGLCKEI
jgi:hypothetical protein